MSAGSDSPAKSPFDILAGDLLLSVCQYPKALEIKTAPKITDTATIPSTRAFIFIIHRPP
jgi:hypothetical protein